MQNMSFYVHIPYCIKRCGYCDFNTYTSKELRGVSQAEFHIPLIEEVQLSKQFLSDWGIPERKLTTVFFGGGTPSMFEASQISAILESLHEQFGFTTVGIIKESGYKFERWLHSVIMQLILK